MNILRDPSNGGARSLLDRIPASRRAILLALKKRGPSTIAELAREVGLTREAVRQQLLQLEKRRWIEMLAPRTPGGGSGRPAVRYALTRAGDHLFPKEYDELAVLLVDAVADELGPEAVRRTLARITDQRVGDWEPRLAGLPLAARLEKLRDVYQHQDPFTHVESLSDGSYRLIERNCPFLEVALRRPALCSVTVNTLSRLLGCKVVREERFQDGARCCAFRVLPDEGGAAAFEPEPDPPSTPGHD